MCTKTGSKHTTPTDWPLPNRQGAAMVELFKVLGLRSKGSGVRISVSPLEFQWFGISSFQVAISRFKATQPSQKSKSVPRLLGNRTLSHCGYSPYILIGRSLFSYYLYLKVWSIMLFVFFCSSVIFLGTVTCILPQNLVSKRCFPCNKKVSHGERNITPNTKIITLAYMFILGYQL